MRKALAVVLMACLAAAPLLTAAQSVQDSSYVPYTPDQLDNLLAPIALYPDPLLAQVLPAATFVDQIDEAARWVRANGEDGIDDQAWDVSVRAVAYYPSVLNMMDENLDWTTAVGQAYVYQSTDVMESIQRLRTMAYAQGNLVTGPQWQVVDQDGYIQIWPANPQYLYVPIYDPTTVFFQPAYAADVISFSVGFAIGAWLNRDCDWHNHRVFYTGWRGGGWIARSRPYVHVTNVYVNNRYTNITVNRTVINRTVNRENLAGYTGVHRNVAYTRTVSNPAGANATGRVNNTIINRNINTDDASLSQFRGREPATQAPPPAPAVRTVPQPYRPELQPQARPAEQTSLDAFTRNAGNFNARVASQRGQSSRAQARPQSAPSRASRSAPKRPPYLSRESP
ncbi:MAG: DUF3300 domain-containing protein [Gammaproteobacteria bacterium]